MSNQMSNITSNPAKLMGVNKMKNTSKVNNKLICKVMLGILAVSRGALWSGAVVASEVGDEQEPSVVMIMVDGVRSDVVQEMVDHGKLPNIKQYFIDGGSWVENSFTPLSLTTPSWTTIMTGTDIDHSGVKGNDVFNRETKEVVNYLDVRGDILFGKNRAHGRAYRDIHLAGNNAIYDYFYRGKGVDSEGFSKESNSDSDVFMTYSPIHDSFPVMNFVTTMPSYLLNLDVWNLTSFENTLVRFLFNYSGTSALDHDSVDQTLAVLRAKVGKKKKFIGVYMDEVDMLSHVDYGRGRDALVDVDYQVGRLMEAISESRYSNSTVFFVGDHGSLGGKDPLGKNEHNPLRGETYNLTMTNLSQVFSGWFNKTGIADYNFNVEAGFASEGKFSLKNLSEIELQPFQCTNASINLPDTNTFETCADYRHKRPHDITAAVTTSETVSLPYGNRLSDDWVTPNNWYTLTHYGLGTSKDGQKTLTKNIIKDLENFELDNLAVFDSELVKKIGKRPLDWVAISVRKEDFNNSAAAKSYFLRSDEDVIVVHQNDQSQGLILQKMSGKNAVAFRYVPVQEFNQSEAGEVSFNLNLEHDPFNYIGNKYADLGSTGLMTSDVEWLQAFHTDREWATRYKNSTYPNVVFALPRFMQFHGNLAVRRDQLRADLYLNPRYGHFFAPNNETEPVNHGMWQRESVNHLFMVSGPGVRQGYRVSAATLSVDVVPTVIRALQLQSDQRAAAGASLKLPGSPALTDQMLSAVDGKPVDEIFE